MASFVLIFCFFTFFYSILVLPLSTYLFTLFSGISPPVQYDRHKSQVACHRCNLCHFKFSPKSSQFNVFAELNQKRLAQSSQFGPNLFICGHQFLSPWKVFSSFFICTLFSRSFRSHLLDSFVDNILVVDWFGRAKI